MPLLNTNLQDVGIEGPPPLEPGVIDIESTSITVTPATPQKAASIKVTFKDANAEEGDDRSVTKVFSLSDKAKPYFKRWLLACRRDDLANADQIDSDQLLHLVCSAVINSRSWVDNDTGEVRSAANVKQFNIPEDMLPEKVE